MNPAFTEYVCNEPLKQGSRFYDPNFLDPAERGAGGEKRIIDYVTSCCHKDAEKRKFLLRFEPTYGNCEKTVQDDRRRCKNFWDLIDQEPLFGALIKEGTFIHESKPDKILNFQHCCNSKTTVVKPCINPMFDQIKLNRAKEREKFQKQREKTNQLQLKSGQKIIAGSQQNRNRDGRVDDDNVYSDMVDDDLDAEMESLDAYNEELMRSKFKIQKKNRYSQFEYMGEGE